LSSYVHGIVAVHIGIMIQNLSKKKEIEMIMKVKLFVVTIIILFFSCKQQEEKKTNSTMEQVEFSLDKWLTKVCERKEQSDLLRIKHSKDTVALPLIENYSQFDTLFKSTQLKILENRESFPILEGIKYDMDSDGKDEIICFIGSVYSLPTMMIFAQKNGNYIKIFEDNFYLHNEYPHLKMIENKEQTLRLITTGGFHHRGSAHWLYANKYYRKIGDEIFEVLESPLRTTEALSIDLLNSSADLVNDTLISDRELRLSYVYETSYSHFLTDKLNTKFEFDNSITLIENKNLKILLDWNEKEMKFLGRDFYKVEALMDIGNDTLQWHSFNKFKNKSVKKEVVDYIEERLD